MTRQLPEPSDPGISIISDESLLAGLEAAWNRLSAREVSPHIASRHFMAFANARWRLRDRGWRCYVLRKDSDSIRVALFGSKSKKVWGWVDTFEIGTEFTSDFAQAPDLQPHELKRLVEAVRRDQSSRPFIDFSWLSGSQRDEVQTCAVSAGWRHTIVPNGHAWVFDTTRSISDLAHRFTPKLRRNLRRDRKRLEEQYKVDLEVLEPHEMDVHLECLEQFSAMEAAGWKGRNESDLGRVGGDYHRCIVERAQGAGRIRWYRLRVDERPAALYFCFRSHDTVWALKTTYDERYAVYSPGNLLLARMLEDACADPEIERVHMLTGPGWLDRWGGSRETYHRVRIFASSVWGRLLYTGDAVRGSWPRFRTGGGQLR